VKKNIKRVVNGDFLFSLQLKSKLLRAAIAKLMKHSNFFQLQRVQVCLVTKQNDMKCLLNNYLLLKTGVSLNKHGDIKNFHDLTPSPFCGCVNHSTVKK